MVKEPAANEEALQLSDIARQTDKLATSMQQTDELISTHALKQSMVSVFGHCSMASLGV